MWMRLLQIAIILAMTSQAAIAGTTIGSIHLGQWSGGAFIGEKTGAIEFCAALAAVEGGFVLTIA